MESTNVAFPTPGFGLGLPTSNPITTSARGTSVSQPVDAEGIARQAAAVADFIALLCSSATSSEVCERAAGELHLHFASRGVMVASVRADGECDCFGLTWKSVDAETRRLLESALQEAVYRDEVMRWSVDQEGTEPGLRVQSQAGEAVGAVNLIAYPIHDAKDSIHCAVLVADAADLTLAERFLHAAAHGMAEVFRLFRDLQPGRFTRLVRSWTASLRSQKIRTTLAVLTLAGCVSLWPTTYHVRTRCVLEPVVKRFVAAPFDGILQQVLVRPGDIVTEGQTLARLDGRDIELELEQARAELHQAKKERAGFVAQHDSGKAKVSELSVRRLQSKADLLEHRGVNLELLSPFAGVVVSGDLISESGTPLSMGDSLFEIAPLDKMMVEIQIPEDQIHYTRVGMEVELSFDAFPFRTETGRLTRIHPRAELIDDANVFVGELLIENDRELLRPGMTGRAKIAGDRYPMIWNWIRGPLISVWRVLGLGP